MVELAAQVPWAVHVHDADTALDLPRPAGEVTIRIHGPVRNLRVSGPTGVPIDVRVHGAASRLSVDGQELGVLGGGHRSSGRGATDRYTLLLAKAVTGLAVTDQSPDGPTACPWNHPVRRPRG